MDIEELKKIIREVVQKEMSQDTPVDSSNLSALDLPTQKNDKETSLDIHFNQKVLTAADLENLESHSVLFIKEGTIISPLVYDVLKDKKISLKYESENNKPTIAIAADHGGYKLKEAIKLFLDDWGYKYFDFGTDSTSSVDYPEYAHKVAKEVSENHYDLGIIVDGAGIGSAITANKVPGIRAALCYDVASAKNSREHNYANVLTLGGRMISVDQARDIIKAWLETPYGAERHARRVRMIHEIEKKYLKE